MENIELNLSKRVDDLFAESEKELMEIAGQVVASIPRKVKKDSLQDLREKLSESGIELQKLSEEFIEYSNNRLMDFEKEIGNIQKPHKTKYLQKYQVLLESEIKQIIENLWRNRLK